MGRVVAAILAGLIVLLVAAVAGLCAWTVAYVFGAPMSSVWFIAGAAQAIAACNAWRLFPDKDARRHG